MVKLTKHPAGFLATVQVGITLINLLSAAVATENFSGRFKAAMINLGVNISDHLLNSISVVVITIILTYFTVLLGELVPKRIGMKKAEKIALGMSGLLSVFSKIFIPAVWLFTVSTKRHFKDIWHQSAFGRREGCGRRNTVDFGCWENRRNDFIQ